MYESWQHKARHIAKGNKRMVNPHGGMVKTAKKTSEHEACIQNFLEYRPAMITGPRSYQTALGISR